MYSCKLSLPLFAFQILLTFVGHKTSFWLVSRFQKNLLWSEIEVIHFHQFAFVFPACQWNNGYMNRNSFRFIIENELKILCNVVAVLQLVEEKHCHNHYQQKTKHLISICFFDDIPVPAPAAWAVDRGTTHKDHNFNSGTLQYLYSCPWWRYARALAFYYELQLDCCTLKKVWDCPWLRYSWAYGRCWGSSSSPVGVLYVILWIARSLKSCLSPINTM